MSSPSSPSILSNIQPEPDLIGNGGEIPLPQLSPLLGKMPQGQEVKLLNPYISSEVKNQIVTSDQLTFANLEASTSNSNLETISISPVDESTISTALQTLFSFSLKTDQPSNSDTKEQDLQHYSQSKTHSHKHKKTGSKTKSKRTSRIKKETRQDRSKVPSKVFSAPSPPSLNTEVPPPNSPPKSGILPQRSISLPLNQATSQQHIQKQHTKTAGSISERSSISGEVKFLYSLTRPVYKNAPGSPIPALSEFLSTLKITELHRLEARFMSSQKRQESSTIVSSSSASSTGINHSQPTELQDEFPQTSIDENTPLTLENIPDLLDKLIKVRKQADWDLVIQNLTQKLPGGLDLFLQILCTKIQTPPSRLEEHALVEILTELLLRLKSQELLKHKDTLEKLKLLHVELYILIHIQIEKAYRNQFINMILTKKDINLIYCHHWIMSSRSLADGLCDHLRSCKDPQQLNLLVEATKLLLDMRIIYPLSISVMSQFDILANQQLADRELADQDPIRVIFQKLKKYYWLAIRPLVPSSRLSPTASSKQVVNTKPTLHQKNWSEEFEEKIKSHKLDSDTLEHLVQDLTILGTYYLNQITPQEFVIWAKQPEKALAIQASSSHFNLLCLLVQSQILTSSDPKVRARYCKFFIQLSKRLVNSGNVDSAYSILSALNAAPISRLKQTWSKVKSDYHEEKEKLDALFSPIENFKNYHSHIQNFLNSNTSSSEAYLVPAVSLLLRALRFSADMKTILNAKSTQDQSEIGCLNFHKLLSLSKICRMFAECQQSTCRSFPQSSLDKISFNITSELEKIKKSQNEDKLWSLSEQYEPLEPQEPQRSSQTQSEKRRNRLSKNLSGSFKINRDRSKQEVE